MCESELRKAAQRDNDNATTRSRPCVAEAEQRVQADEIRSDPDNMIKGWLTKEETCKLENLESFCSFFLFPSS